MKTVYWFLATIVRLLKMLVVWLRFVERFRLLCVFFLFSCPILLLLSVRANADEFRLLNPIAGYSITPLNKSQTLYGKSNPTANWRVAQWQNPGGNLPPFSRVPCDGACYISRGPAAQVSYEVKLHAGQTSLRQDGSIMPCETKGHPTEFDLFISPQQFRRIKLSQMKGLGLSLDFTINSAQVLFSRCKVNQGQILAALVLRNTSTAPLQVFFYQLSLYRFQVRADPTGWWAPGVLRQSGRLKRFGFRDSLASFGLLPTRIGEPTSVEIPVLQRIRDIIISGAHGIDTNVEHWELRHAYFGQHIWGKVAISSTWRSIKLNAHR